MAYTAKPLPPSNSIQMIASAKKQSITGYLQEAAPGLTRVIEATRGEVDVDLSHVESIAVCDAMIAQLLEQMEAYNAELGTFAASAFIDRYQKLTELRRKLADSEIERRKYGAHLIEADEVKRLASEIVDSDRRHVRDPNTILKITGDIGRIVKGLSPVKPEPELSPSQRKELAEVKEAAGRGEIGEPLHVAATPPPASTPIAHVVEPNPFEDDDPLAGM